MRVVCGGIVAVLGLVSHSGCVSKWTYDEQVEKTEHLSAVKTEQDIELGGLHADVNAIHRAYSQQSMRMTSVEGVVTQAMTELRSIETKLSSLNQDLIQQRGEVSKLSAQSSETLQILRALNEQQQTSTMVLNQLAMKVDTLKPITPPKAARATAGTEGKGAVQRAMDQQMGAGVRVERPAPAPAVAPRPTGGNPDAKPVGPTVGTAPAATGIPTTAAPSVPAAALPATPVVPTASAPAPIAQKPDEMSSTKTPDATTSSVVSPAPSAAPASPTDATAKVEDTESPLHKPVVAAKPEEPQGWLDWIKGKIWGKGPVQTASQVAPPSGASSEKK